MDASQFRQFYQQQSRLMRKAAEHCGASASDADDAVQEAFLRALETSGLDDPVLPLLMHIARNEARRSWRREKRYLYIDGLDEMKGGSPTPEEALQVQRQVDFLMGLINGLHADRRTVFVMAEIYEEPLPKIAAGLGVPLTTAESRLRDARHDLKEAVRLARVRGTFPAIILLFSDISQRIDALWSQIRSWRPLRHVVGSCAAVIVLGLVPMGGASSPRERQGKDGVVQAIAQIGAAAKIEEAGARSQPPTGPPPAAVPPERHTQRKATAAAAPASDRAAREGLRMLQVQDALAAGHVDEALAELRNLEKQYPGGYYAPVRQQMFREIQQHRKQSSRTPAAGTHGMD